MKYRISPPKKFVIRLLIATVLWFSMGSLVNFHMNRIFGVELISPTLYCQRQKDKTLKAFKDITGESHGFSLQLAEMPSTFSHLCYPVYFGLLRQSDVVTAHPLTSCHKWHGLRAPPVS
ncbi:MAG TPA: hypothetical protein DCR43_07140 [Bacteroidales bacterium]|nr:MAG: hypothetical protein A2X11_16610 [Bacteroidetes bacterium GWE2_42_24]OFY26333.1 MAG: hypothetical protein A2X09_00085 [Bacteroidetes bacterium GWF2_43_11]PKP23744.1 MAG: hypothetical protein CVU06_06695 [Bacteroidetes bacterium HGW-Bacteroidetes-22]HAQ65608.1 hypothetical protein [Bacteroidales bacterium]HBZ66914.1 hypothetical protein [Bacteroidales bacterium]